MPPSAILLPYIKYNTGNSPNPCGNRRKKIRRVLSLFGDKPQNEPTPHADSVTMSCSVPRHHRADLAEVTSPRRELRQIHRDSSATLKSGQPSSRFRNHDVRLPPVTLKESSWTGTLTGTPPLFLLAVPSAAIPGGAPRRPGRQDATAQRDSRPVSPASLSAALNRSLSTSSFRVISITPKSSARFFHFDRMFSPPASNMP